MPDLPFSSTSGRMLGPDDIAARAFPSARRGVDGEAVRRFLVEVADQVRDLRRERDELRVAATAVRQAPAPKLDDATLTKALGEETAHVLQVARETAHALVQKAEEQAAELIKGAETLSVERREEAENKAREITESAATEVQEIIERTKAQCREMIEEAREVRRRILADLAERRRTLLVQLEQIRVGKESILGVVESVATTVAESIDAVRTQLAGADEHARIAVEQSTSDLDETTSSGEDVDALVAEAFAKLPVSAPGAGLLSGSAKKNVEDAQKVFDIERDDQPRPSSNTGSATRTSAGSTGGTSVAGSPSSTPVPETPLARMPDVTPTAQQVSVTLPTAQEVRPTPPTPAPAPPGEVETTTKPLADEDHSPVDELFAKIRASRESEVAEAQRVLADTTEGAPASASKSSTQSRRQESHTAVKENTNIPTASLPAEHPAAVPQSTASEDVADVNNASVPVEPTDVHRDQRDAVLNDVHTELSRSLKRVLREEQNILLDALRNRKKNIAPRSLMPSEESRSRLIDATTPGLVVASSAAREFFESGSGKVKKNAADEALAKVAAERLSREILEALVQRLTPGLTEDPDFSGDVNEIVGAAFRDWKAARVEALAGDYVTEVFGASSVAYAKGKKLSLNWHVDDGAQKCPDCDDNAVAGGVRAGEPFPTGHAHPPVHPGCRCFLII